MHSREPDSPVNPYIDYPVGALVEQRRNGNLQCSSNLGDVSNGGISQTPLDASQVRAMDLGLFGQSLLRPAFRLA